MAKMKPCKTCSKEVASSAKTCPHCGAKLRMGFLKKALIGIGGFIILLIVIGIAAGSNGNKQVSSTNAPVKVEITKDTYDKIQTDMTKDQVETILGKANSVSESETPGVGKMEMHHYQKTFETKAIDVTYLNGKVYNKNWTQL